MLGFGSAVAEREHVSWAALHAQPMLCSGSAVAEQKHVFWQFYG